jgi:hypothetical protein
MFRDAHANEIFVVAKPTRGEIMAARFQLFARTPFFWVWGGGALALPMFEWMSRGFEAEWDPRVLGPFGFFLLLPFGMLVSGIASKGVRELCERGIRYTFSDANVVAQSESARTEFSWTTVQRAWESRTFVAMRVGASLVIVPKRCLEAGDLPRLIGLLVEKGKLKGHT